MQQLSPSHEGRANRFEASVGPQASQGRSVTRRECSAPLPCDAPLHAMPCTCERTGFNLWSLRACVGMHQRVPQSLYGHMTSMAQAALPMKSSVRPVLLQLLRLPQLPGHGWRSQIVCANHMAKIMRVGACYKMRWVRSGAGGGRDRRRPPPAPPATAHDPYYSARATKWAYPIAVQVAAPKVSPGLRAADTPL